MDADQLLLRPEQPADADAVNEVVAEAFRQPWAAGTPAEVALVHALRAHESWIAALCLVAEVDDRVVGQVTCSRGRVDDVPAIGLGPVAVAPDQQGRSVGTALMTTVLRLAADAGEPLVALLGDPGYYARFGFVRADTVGIQPPDPAWAPHFQVAVLNPPAPTGTFHYAAPFSDL